MPLQNDRYSLLPQQGVFSPQLRATTGMSPRLSYGDYLEGASQALPAIYAAEEQKRLADEQRKLQLDQMNAIRSQARTGLAIEGANTLYQVPAIQSRVNQGVGLAANTIANQFKPINTGVTESTGALIEYPVMEPSPVNQAIGSAKGFMNTPVSAGTSLTRVQALGSTVGGYSTGTMFSPTGIARGFGEEAQEAMGFGGKKEWNTVGGALSGAASGFVTSGFNPVGALVGLVSGAVGSRNKVGCIIVTACTDKNSYEVKITREFRDKYMDNMSLRGYYMIAEQIVPLIQKYGWFKKFIKRNLVDRLVDVGEYVLGKKEEKPKILSRIVTWSFLKMCRITGATRREFVRCTGEAI